MSESDREDEVELLAVRKRGDVINTSAFILKLYNILEVYYIVFQDLYNRDLLNWNPDGTKFEIIDKDKFIQEILPKHFKHKKYSSFLRQVNIYGFNKVKDDGTSYFYHKSFQKNQK